MRALGALVVMVVVLSYSQAADACGAPQCVNTGRFHPAPGEQVPQNVGALVLDKADLGAAPQLQLLDPNGAQVTVLQTEDADHWFFQPSALTLLGPYTAKFADDCTSGGPTVSSTFDVGAFEGGPVDGGVLSLQASGHGQVTAQNDTLCTAALSAAWAQLRFQPSAEMAHVLPVSFALVSVDSSPWASSGYGGVKADGTLKSIEPRSPLLIYGACDGGSSGTDLGLGLGQHEATLSMFVAGRPDPLVMGPVAFTLSCEGDAGQPPSLPDAGPTGPGGPGETGGGGEGGGELFTPKEGCGCGSTTVALLPFAFLALLTLRPRRTPPGAR